MRVHSNQTDICDILKDRFRLWAFAEVSRCPLTNGVLQLLLSLGTMPGRRVVKPVKKCIRTWICIIGCSNSSGLSIISIRNCISIQSIGVMVV